METELKLKRLRVRKVNASASMSMGARAGLRKSGICLMLMMKVEKWDQVMLVAQTCANGCRSHCVISTALISIAQNPMYSTKRRDGHLM